VRKTTHRPLPATAPLDLTRFGGQFLTSLSILLIFIQRIPQRSMPPQAAEVP
jgi:hypothetical protein